MPEPKSKYCLNRFISYPFANMIGSNLCGICSPNFITLIGILFSIWIFWYLIETPCNYKKIFILCTIRAFLDILDGAVARRCKEESNFGSKLDKTSDFFFEYGLLAIFCYKIYKNQQILKNPYFYSVFSLSIVIVFFWISESLNQIQQYCYQII